MARGFESKSVADQQESAFEEDRPPRDVADPSTTVKRRSLELARADVLQRMEVARVEAHREMLRRALAALEKQLAELS